MSRWIDIDDISLLKTVSVGGLSAKALWKRIRQQPSIDLVRCGECKYRKNRIDYEKDYCIEHSKVIYNTDGYCSWAERSSE